jgi:hypothetical protein
MAPSTAASTFKQTSQVVGTAGAWTTVSVSSAGIPVSRFPPAQFDECGSSSGKPPVAEFDAAIDWSGFEDVSWALSTAATANCTARDQIDSVDVMLRIRSTIAVRPLFLVPAPLRPSVGTLHDTTQPADRTRRRGNARNRQRIEIFNSFTSGGSTASSGIDWGTK